MDVEINKKDSARPIVKKNLIKNNMPSFRDSSSNETQLFSCVSWRSVFAGLAVSALVLTVLMALGVAISGHAIDAMSDGDGLAGYGIGTAIWTALSISVALFAGSFFTGRLSGFVSARVGAAQGLVVASIFVLSLVWAGGNTLGALTSGFTQAVSSVGGGAAQVASSLSKNSEVQAVVNEAVDGLDLKDNPETIFTQLSTYLVQGKTQLAERYLAHQASITVPEARERIATLKTNFSQTASKVIDKTGRAIALAGWFIFGTFVLGILSALAGGAIGTKRSSVHLITRDETTHSLNGHSQSLQI